MNRHLHARTALTSAAVVLLVVASASAQAPATSSGKTWKAPRTADGHPDLQGVWGDNGATPLQRPKALAGKTVLSEQELAALKDAASKIFDGGGDAAFGDQVFEAALDRVNAAVSTDGKTGNYNHFWLVEREFDNRTSLITDPPDGRIPPLTPAAQAFVASQGGRARGEGDATAGRADSWEDRGLSERCISFGAPRLLAGYNSYIQVLQSRDVVTIVQETIHDARVIPLDGRPHLPDGIRQWHGDSRGRWEGDTLVVETTNYSPKSRLLVAANSLEHARVTERFTRVGPDTLKHEITFDDPTTWTKPWTMMVLLKQTDDKIYEYACHEGNTGMYGILAGAREEEKQQKSSEPKTR
jgi:hypothetical protein